MTQDHPINRYLTRYPIAAVAIYAGVVFLLLFATWVGVADMHGAARRGRGRDGAAGAARRPQRSKRRRCRSTVGSGADAARHSSKGRR